MRKFEWVEYLDFKKIEQKISGIPCSFSNEIDLDCLIIIKGETHYKMSLLAILTLLLNTNINKTSLNLLIDNDLYENHQNYFEYLKGIGINIYIISDDTMKLFSYGICKFDFITKDFLKNDVVIIDCDVFVNQEFDFTLLKHHHKDELWFLDKTCHNSMDIFLDRYGWAYRSGKYNGLKDFFNKILNFINSNREPITYDDFIESISKPKIEWFNCGIGIVPLKVRKDPLFLRLCSFIRDELNIGSDEFVYFIYANFFGNNVNIFSRKGIPIFLASMYPQKNGFFHFYNTNDKCLEKTLLELNRHYPKDFFLRLDKKDGLNYANEFVLNSKWFAVVSNIDIARSINEEDFFYYSLNDNKLEMTCKFSKEENSYYMNMNFLNKNYLNKKIYLFDDVPKQIIIYYDPKFDYDELIGFNIIINDIELNEYVNRDIYLNIPD